ESAKFPLNRGASGYSLDVLALRVYECQGSIITFHSGGCTTMKLKPLGDRLIVRAIEEEETTASGIVLPDTAKEKPQKGNVLAVGPGSRNDEGNIIPMEIAEGDEIIFSKYGGTEVKLGSDDVLILRESDVLAKVIGTREPAGAAA